MAAFLLWVRSFDETLKPQLFFDDEGSRPCFDRALRAVVASWTLVSAEEATLSLREIARRHPPQMNRMLSKDE